MVSALRRWKEYFEDMVNKENERERGMEQMETVKLEVKEDL